MWKYIIAIVLFVAVIGGSYYKGRHDVEAKYEEIRKQDEARIAELEQKQNEVTTKIVTEYVDRVKTIKQKEYVYVDQAKSVVPSKSELSNGWVYLHDTSAKGLPAVPARSSDEGSSGIKDNIALGTIVSNYSICHQTAEQLIQLQQWIRNGRIQKSIPIFNSLGSSQANICRQCAIQIKMELLIQKLRLPNGVRWIWKIGRT